MKSVCIEKSELKGVDVIGSNEWDGEIIRLSRQVFDKYKDDSFLDIVGTYIIYADHYDKQTRGNEIYVGQGDDVRQRLREHSARKPYWNKVLIFTSEKMNTAIAFNIEKNFILRAKTSSKYSVMNGDSGQTKKLGKDDWAYTTKYIEDALSVLDLAGIDIFTINMDGVFSVKGYYVDASVVLVGEDAEKVRILEGSRILNVREGDDILGNQSIQQFVEIADEEIKFLKSYTVDIDGSPFERILDGKISLTSCKNNCGVSLSSVLREIKQTGSESHNAI